MKRNPLAGRPDNNCTEIPHYTLVDMKIKRSVQAKFESNYFVYSEKFLVKSFLLSNNCRGMSEMDEKKKTHKDFISKGKARFDISPPVMSLT